jgi:hypothetical protein
MKIVYLGRYKPNEILTGPEKVAKLIFHNIIEITSHYMFNKDYFDNTIF